MNDKSDQYPQLQMVKAHKHTCVNVQPGSTEADVCDCGAVVDGKPVPAKPFSLDEVHLLRGVAQGLGQSAEKTTQEWMGIVYQLKNTVAGNIWRDADKQAYDSAADLPEYDRRVLYAAPDPQYRELALQLLDAQEKLKEARKLLMDALDDMEYGDGQSHSLMYSRLRKYRDTHQLGLKGMEPRNAE